MPEALHRLKSGSCLAWANDTTAHYEVSNQLDLRCCQQTYHCTN